MTFHLTHEEAEFVHNVEVLGLPIIKAAKMAGLPYAQTRESHIAQAREAIRQEIAGRLRVTKEDSARGILDAIDRAKNLSEPMTEIAGWKEINQMYGHNEPQQVNINVKESITVVQQQLRQLPDAKLIELLGDGNVIDGEFYEHKADGRP